MDQDEFPCKCGHLIIAHGEIPESNGKWKWDTESEEELWVVEQYPRPVCFDCGPYDCIFEPMTNLEYLEYLYKQKEKII